MTSIGAYVFSRRSDFRNSQVTDVEFQLRVMIDIKGFGFDIYFLSDLSSGGSVTQAGDS